MTIKRSSFLRNMAFGLSASFVLAACGGAGTETAEPTDGEPIAEETTEATEGGAGALTVATEPAFPPFEFQAEDGELQGFDIDLMNAIGETAGLEIQFESLPFDGIIPALQAGTVDAAISGMTITEERLETVDFSRPYIKAGLAIAVKEEDTDINGLADLEDKRIAVQIGTTGADQAAEVPGAEVSTFDSAPLALQELSNGNVDAVINDAPVTLDAIESGNIEGLKVVGELLTTEFYGIALPKDSENVEVINDALMTMMEDGTYAEIYQKWFGDEPPELPESAF
ncbi:basic amino acid ABC transporter substrate-binding protein [Oscillatoria sp. CS-180]|uniref:basic amino acid ABC transporter substrate-binding protein n=1 Tax=Oscillatoria sp. CS-180 TaxID=3021720 RepID=UPI00232F23DB|nr:basic amino acid ABC transporter substrate-binding protein [Oscillatoria sp. CS-180]MDB9524471.1 basic amino acid ABC transporter substrate-binding protein [Oscillatoria sp. CS-180]